MPSRRSRLLRGNDRAAVALSPARDGAASAPDRTLLGAGAGGCCISGGQCTGLAPSHDLADAGLSAVVIEARLSVAVVIPGDDGFADLSVEAALPLVVEERRDGIEPLDYQTADRTLFAEPVRRADAPVARRADIC